MVYHSLKIKLEGLPFNEPPLSTATRPIIFLSKTLLFIETRYWFIELKMTGLVWVIWKLYFMMLSSELPVTVFMNHSVNPAIAWQTKLVTANTAKQNLWFIKTLMYLSKFNLWVLYCSKKSYTVSNALNWLFSRNIMNASEDAFDIKAFHTFTESMITISENFHKWL